MFKLECLIDDKKLAPALRALDGMIFEPKVVPVTGAVVKNGRVTENGSGENLAMRAHALLREAGAKSVTPADLRAATERAGASPDSYTYVAKKLTAAKLLRRSGSAGSYKYRLIGGEK